MEQEPFSSTPEMNEIEELHATIDGIEEAQELFLAGGDDFIKVTDDRITIYRQKIIDLYRELEKKSPEFKSAIEEAIKAEEEIDK